MGPQNLPQNLTSTKKHPSKLLAPPHIPAQKPQKKIPKKNIIKQKWTQKKFQLSSKFGKYLV